MNADPIHVARESRAATAQQAIDGGEKRRERRRETLFRGHSGINQLATIALVTLFVLPVAAFAQRSTNVTVVNPETSPVPVAAITTVEYMLVGVSTTTTSGRILFGGAQGIAAADAICQQDFGTSARMATVSDRVLVDAIPLPAPAAWTNVAEYDIVEPLSSQFVAFSTANASVRSPVGPFLRAVEGITCAGFASGGDDTGAFTRADGHRGMLHCSSVAPVACARPVDIPVLRP